VGIFGFLIIAGIIASTAGPSSAILMIPQVLDWDTGDVDFYLNGTATQLWPTPLTIDHIGPDNCNSSDAIQDPYCAAGGYPALYAHFSALTEFPYSSAFTLNIEDSLTKGTLQGNIRNDWQEGSETWTQSPHAATAAIEEPVREDWSFGLLSRRQTNAIRYQYSDSRRVQVQTQIPFVRTACVPTTNLTSDESTLPFPVLPEYGHWYDQPIISSGPDAGSGAWSIGPLKQSTLSECFGDIWGNLNTTSDGLNFKSQWTPLSSDFGSATTGLALVFPPSDITTGGMAISCTVDARWANGTNWMSFSQSSWGWAEFYTPMQSSSFQPASNTLFNPVNDSTWRRITTFSDYLAATTPVISNNLTTLEDIINRTIPNFIDINSLKDYFHNDSMTLVSLVEHITSTLLVDAIARTGSNLQSTMSFIQANIESSSDSATGITGPALVPPPGSTDTGPNATITWMKMETSISGYAYMMSSFTSYLAIVVLLTHSLIALCHTVCILWTRKTSGTWETIPELVALAQNSCVANTTLEGTGAGIKNWGTWKITAKVVVRRGGEGERVELVWDGDGAEHSVDPGVEYN
jgi:hypothetical protein